MKRYFDNAFTHNYIIGFAENGKVYASLVINDDNLIESLMAFDTCKGRERFYYRQNSKKISQLRQKAVFEVCTIEQLEQLEQGLALGLEWGDNIGNMNRKNGGDMI